MIVLLFVGTNFRGFRGSGKPRNLVPNEEVISHSLWDWVSNPRIQESTKWSISPKPRKLVPTNKTTFTVCPNKMTGIIFKNGTHSFYYQYIFMIRIPQHEYVGNIQYLYGVIFPLYGILGMGNRELAERGKTYWILSLLVILKVDT